MPHGSHGHVIILHLQKPIQHATPVGGSAMWRGGGGGGGGGGGATRLFPAFQVVPLAWPVAVDAVFVRRARRLLIFCRFACKTSQDGISAFGLRAKAHEEAPFGMASRPWAPSWRQVSHGVCPS